MSILRFEELGSAAGGTPVGKGASAARQERVVAEGVSDYGGAHPTPNQHKGGGEDSVSESEFVLNPAPTLIAGRVLDTELGVGVSGVVMFGLPGRPVTDVDGNYCVEVEVGWRGLAEPRKPSYVFSPPGRLYDSVGGSELGQDYVATPTAVLSVTPAAGLLSSGERGGSFEPVSQIYMLTNVGSEGLDWTAGHRRDFVSVQPSGGRLEAGASTAVTVSIGAAAGGLGVGVHEDTVVFTNETTHAGDAVRAVQVTATGPGWVSPWTNRGFDVAVSGSFGAAAWDPYTKDRYVIVPRGAIVTLTIARNADLRRADGSPSSEDNTRVHVGLLTIARRQFWTPDWEPYEADGSFVYEWPVSVGPVDEPLPVQIWNQHSGCDFDASNWLAYGSNAMEVWLLPEGATPGNLPPVDYANGRTLPGELTSAPPGVWPALYRDVADEARLHAAVEKLGTTLHGDGGPYDGSSHGNYWPDVSAWAARNALIGWHRGSAAHLREARRQLLALFSVRTFTNESAIWTRSRCVPNADLTTSYGRELSNIFFEALVAACALGPNMSNVLDASELAAVNAHLYRFAIEDIFASLTTEQYYTANGSINLHYQPICVTAGWNWGVNDAVVIADLLPEPTHTECSYFLDALGTGQYALRYCQLHDAADKSYEDVGNSQSVRYWLRFAEFMDQRVDLIPVERYVADHYAGVTLDCQDALDALMDGWAPEVGEAR